ncbi:hypothetical protein NH398_06045 [Halomonas sp. CnH100-B]|uniref:hypothetical protein n=1 Tax=Halomonas sp. CnH100-B TaxID=2954490 RepID=UPI002096A02F|nr:hypothetical protein [Halomonas sp. CnH100-B]MCO7228791.1 hypothetical protein [Halomonas sp. CnH100-B]
MSGDYVWRYMSLAKYIDLVSSKSIFVPKASLFNDATEGKWIAHAVLWGDKNHWAGLKLYADRLSELLEKTGSDQNKILSEGMNLYDVLDNKDRGSVLGDVLKGLVTVYPHKRYEYIKTTLNSWLSNYNGHNDRVNEWVEEVAVGRECTYISCWNRADFMSLAMWNVYGGSEESVAVRVRTSRLEELLKENSSWLDQNGMDAQIVDVEYIEGLKNPNKELRSRLIKKLGVGKDVRIGTFSIKPAIYEYESEMRIIVHPRKNFKEKLFDPHPELDGLYLSVCPGGRELSEFIDAVCIHPLLDSNSMIYKVLSSVNKQYGLPDLPIITDKVEALGSTVSLKTWSMP